MHDSLTFVKNISIEPPYAKIYHRLGYKKRTTQISVSQQKEAGRFIEQALSFITLQGSILRTTITKNDGENIALSGDLIFCSKKLSALLHGCPEALLMGATAGCAITEAIREKTAQNNLAAAVVYDATASEMADAALDWIMDYLNQQVRREGKKILSRRFSAGYADFGLENQELIYQKLQMEKIGVTITPNFILLPEKSVTAITGICG